MGGSSNMFGEDKMHQSTCNPCTRGNCTSSPVKGFSAENSYNKPQHTKFGDVLPKRFTLYGGCSLLDSLNEGLFAYLTGNDRPRLRDGHHEDDRDGVARLQRAQRHQPPGGVHAGSMTHYNEVGT